MLNRYLADLLGCGVPVVYDKLEELLNQILPKKPLHVQHDPEDIDEFAHSVITSQGRLMANNFVPWTSGYGKSIGALLSVPGPYTDTGMREGSNYGLS